MKTGMLFGTFDGIHPGHLAMLREAKQFVDHLCVVVPPDATVAMLKRHTPKHSWSVRAQALKDTGLVDDVLEGDQALGTYSMLRHTNPDVIFVGYDQHDLRTDLARYLEEHHKNIPLHSLSPYEPDRYKSSLITPL